VSGRTIRRRRPAKRAPSAETGKTGGSLFSSTTSQVLGYSIPVVLASLGALLSPLGDAVRDGLWPEQFVIEPQVVRVSEGQLVPLSIPLTDHSGRGVSGGRVTIKSRDESVTITRPTFPFKASEGSIDLSGAVLRADAPGRRTLDVTVTTGKGTTVSGTIQVDAKASGARPSYDVWTGEWLVLLNGRQGTLRLTQHNATDFRGTLILSDGKEPMLRVSGWHDGKPFHMDIVAPDGLTYIARGVHCEVGTRQRYATLNGKVERLRGGRLLPLEQPLTDFPAICPPRDGVTTQQDLATKAGDGTLYATAALRDTG
jgi:hypothetical protein